MFERSIQAELKKWRIRDGRKPLIIRGARQVGKTTVVRQFSREFKEFIYLNLELPEDRKPFEEFSNMQTLVQALFFLKNKLLDDRSETLIFIDEIQEVPEALQVLRYFYEEYPEIPVIAAGSMLESLFSPNISFPVGRVEYLVVHPVSFQEFLGAIGETTSIDQMNNIPLKEFAHDKLLGLFRTYCLIGGMPEIIASYANKKDLTSLSPFTNRYWFPIWTMLRNTRVIPPRLIIYGMPFDPLLRKLERESNSNTLGTLPINREKWGMLFGHWKKPS